MEGVFRFYDFHDNIEENYCIVKINISIMTYHNKQQYYDISYSYSYINNDTINNDTINTIDIHKTNRTNPFYYKQSQLCDDAYEGVIVYKNDITDQLVKYLMMKDEELDNICGNTWMVQYRANIMFMLALMWD